MTDSNSSTYTKESAAKTMRTVLDILHAAIVRGDGTAAEEARQVALGYFDLALESARMAGKMEAVDACRRGLPSLSAILAGR